MSLTGDFDGFVQSHQWVHKEKKTESYADQD
jgi:hypothetical protein